MLPTQHKRPVSVMFNERLEVLKPPRFPIEMNRSNDYDSSYISDDDYEEEESPEYSSSDYTDHTSYIEETNTESQYENVLYDADPRLLFVCNLPYDWQYEEILPIFRKFGPGGILPTPDNHRLKSGFLFYFFYYIIDAYSFMNQNSTFQLRDLTVKVSYCQQPMTNHLFKKYRRILNDPNDPFFRCEDPNKFCDDSKMLDKHYPASCIPPPPYLNFTGFQDYQVFPYCSADDEEVHDESTALVHVKAYRTDFLRLQEYHYDRKHYRFRKKIKRPPPEIPVSWCFNDSIPKPPLFRLGKLVFSGCHWPPKFKGWEDLKAPEEYPEGDPRRTMTEKERAIDILLRYNCLEFP